MNPSTFADISTLRVSDDIAETRTIVSTPATEFPLALSPDSRWLAYRSDISGQFEIYVQPFPDADSAQPQLISVGGGHDPLWGPNGRELFYRGPDGVMVVDVTTADTFARRGSPRVLFPDSYYRNDTRDWDILSDGQRFLMIKPDAQVNETPQEDITVVLNWSEELKARVPVD